MEEFNPSNFVCYTDPWRSDDNEILHFEVDLDSAENAKPKQELKEDEDIQVIFLKLKDLKKEVENLVFSKKWSIYNQRWTFALSMSLII